MKQHRQCFLCDCVMEFDTGQRRWFTDGHGLGECVDICDHCEWGAGCWRCLWSGVQGVSLRRKIAVAIHWHFP